MIYNNYILYIIKQEAISPVQNRVMGPKPCINTAILELTRM